MSDEIRVSTGNYKYAGFWIRLAAYLIDAAIIFILNLLFSGGAVIESYSDFSMDIMTALSRYWVTFVVPIVYFIVFWGALSTTPGKMLLKLKIIDVESGGKIGWVKAILRLLGYFVSGAGLYLGFIWIAFDQKKRGWHDFIAKTYVIHKR